MMKLEFPKKKKVFTKNNVLPDPNGYWLWIFVAGFVLTLCFFAFALHLFIKINNEAVLNDESENRALQKIGKPRIDKVLATFSQRVLVSNEIVASPSPVVDPSL